MDLSRALLKGFAKTINDQSANQKVTSNLVGTVKTVDGKKYVQVDGSSVTTPVSETIDIQDGDRVLVSIENHTATVIGNYTYPPSARTANQAQAMAEYSVEQFEALVAIAITTENLKANVAEIGVLTADEASIAYAKITDLDAVKADIDTLTAKAITTDNIEAEVGKFGYVTATQVSATYAKITDLDAVKADIDTLTAKAITTDNLKAKVAEVGFLTADEIDAKYATIDNLDATKAEIESAFIDYAKITDLEAAKAEITAALIDYATIEQLNAVEADIIELRAADAEILEALIGYAKVVDLEAVSTRTTSLETEVADINTLVNGNLTSDNIQSLTLNSTNVTIADGTITNAMIKNLEFGKITGIDINTTNLTIHSEDGKSTWTDNTIQISDATRVRVQIGKDDSGDYTLAVWDAAGNLIWDALGATENTIQRKIIRDAVVADDAAIAGSKLDIPSVVEEINGSQTKLKSTTILIDETNQTLDVYLTTIESTIDDNLDAAKQYADGQLSVAQAYALEQANAALASSKEYTDDEISDVNTDITNLTEITTTHSTDISVMQGQISSLIAEDTTIKGDYEALVSRYNATVADVDSIKTTIGEHTTLLDTQSGEIQAVTTKTNTIESDLESTKQTISSIQTTLSNKADGSTVEALTTRVVNCETSLAGFEVSLATTNQTVTDNYTALQKYTDDAKASAISTANEYTDGEIEDVQDEIDSTNATVAEHTTTISSHETQIAANETAIGLRVTSQEYETYKALVNGQLTDIGSRMTSAESSITALEGQISLKVEQTDITSAINGIVIGGRNLIRNSNFVDRITNWEIVTSELSATFVSDTINGSAVSCVYLTRKTSYTPNMLTFYNSNYFTHVSGKKYTLSFWAKSDVNNQLILFVNINGNNTIASRTLTTTWTKYTVTYTAGASGSLNFNLSMRGPRAFLTNIKLEEGSKATDWTPAPEDVDSAISNVDAKFANYSTTTQMQAAIDISKNSILSSVSETYTTKTEYSTLNGTVSSLESWKAEATQKLTPDGIKTIVGNYYATTTDLGAATERIAAAESTITQHAESISLRVEKAGIISAINQTAESVKIDASKINLTASGIIDIINSGTTKIAAKNIDLSGYVTVTDLSTKGRTTIVGDNITSGTITGIAFKGVTGDFAGKITASELVTKVLMHDAVYGEIYFTSGTIHLSTRDHSNPLDPDAISYLSLSSYLTGSSELFSMSSLVLAGYDGVYIEAENKGTVAEFNHTQVEITPRLTVLNGLYMGSPTQTGTERQITFVINSGTYPHHSYIYGGNSNSQSAIGIWDNKNGRHVWRYYDTYGTFEVNVPLILKNGFEIYGTYPNIDFHYNNNGSSDYTSRIIEMSSGILQVNGVKFSSSNITAARGSFYGTYTSTLGSRYGNQALEIRENGLVTNTQSDVGYAPAIGFHWAGRIAASLVFHNDGGFRFMNQAYTDFVPVFVSTLYLGGAPYGQIYCGTSYQLYINPRGSGSVYIGYDNRCIVPPTGGAAIRGNGDGTYDCGHTSYLWGTVYAKNGVKTTSDEREKDIMNLDLSELSDCFMSIKPIAFRWKYGSDKKIHLGVGAQTTERKMIEAGYDPSQFDMIQHDDLEERSVSGLMERYGINYQDLNMLTMMQTQKNAREIQLINVDLSLFKDEQDELKEEVQNLKRELALANQKIAELSAKTA